MFVSSARGLDGVYRLCSLRSECFCIGSATVLTRWLNQRRIWDPKEMHWQFSENLGLERLILRSIAESVELNSLVEPDPVLQWQRSITDCIVVSDVDRTLETHEVWNPVDVETGEHPLHFIQVE